MVILLLTKLGVDTVLVTLLCVCYCLVTMLQVMVEEGLNKIQVNGSIGQKQRKQRRTESRKAQEQMDRKEKLIVKIPRFQGRR